MNVDGTQAPSPHRPYWPQLDGLRTIAVAGVGALHGSYGIMRGGFLGVDLFFVLSGFLITSLLADELERNGKIDFKLFYIRRFLRLYPPLVVVVLGAAFLWHAGPPPEVGYPRMAFAALFYHANLVIGHSLLSHTWSLSMEEQFYIVWPCLFALIWGSWMRRWYLLPTLAIVFSTVLVRRSMILHHATTADIYFFPFARMDSLIIGATVALTVRKDFFVRLAQRHLNILKTVGVLSFLCMAALFLRAEKEALQMWGYTLVSVLFSVLIASVAMTGPKASYLNRMLASRPMVFIGRRSYGIYLYHLPVFLLCENLRVAHSLRNYVWVTVLRFGISLALAFLSFDLLEKRMLALKSRFEPKAILREDATLVAS